jgi:hypothetical protein
MPCYQQAILNISDLCGKFNIKKERYPQKYIFFHQDIHRCELKKYKTNNILE